MTLVEFLQALHKPATGESLNYRTRGFSLQLLTWAVFCMPATFVCYSIAYTGFLAGIFAVFTCAFFLLGIVLVLLAVTASFAGAAVPYIEQYHRLSRTAQKCRKGLPGDPMTNSPLSLREGNSRTSHCQTRSKASSGSGGGESDSSGPGEGEPPAAQLLLSLICLSAFTLYTFYCDLNRTSSLPRNISRSRDGCCRIPVYSLPILRGLAI